ncbi:MAG: phosphotransferase [Pirellulales bacterium]
MQRHAQFDLWWHDDQELAAALGSPIVRRLLLQQWPLSRVEIVECADGRKIVYKTQAAPTVEPQFYHHARSPLVVEAQSLDVPSGPPALLLRYVEAARLGDSPISPEAALAHADHVVDAIGQIDGDLPAVLDLRPAAAWNHCAASILADLQTLADGAQHPAIGPALVARVEHCGRGALIDQALTTPMGYVHGDLLASNVLVQDGEYRVLDWQRPFWGSVELDRAALLGSLGVDPRQHVAPGVLQLQRLLAIGWFAAQAVRWFPPGADWFAAELARVAAQLEDDRDG